MKIQIQDILNTYLNNKNDKIIISSDELKEGYLKTLNNYYSDININNSIELTSLTNLKKIDTNQIIHIDKISSLINKIFDKNIAIYKNTVNNIGKILITNINSQLLYHSLTNPKDSENDEIVENNEKEKEANKTEEEEKKPEEETEEKEAEAKAKEAEAKAKEAEAK